MKDFEQLEQLLKKENFNLLSQDEKTWVESKIGIQAFQELLKITSALKMESQMISDNESKADLIKQIKSKNSSKSFGWLSYKAPVYASFLTLFTIIPLTWFLVPAKEVIVERIVEVDNPTVDTVIVKLPSDTIVLERIVRVEIPIYLTKESSSIEVKKKEIQKKSFSEQKSLQNLLVSGK